MVKRAAPIPIDDEAPHILVVDDDPNIRKELDALLYRARISSRTIQSADRVLDLVRRDHYSLVLVADHFPQMKDFELVQQLKAAYPAVDVVVSSWDPPMGLINLAFWFATNGQRSWNLYLLYGWSGVFATLALIRFWTLTGDHFTVTQAKRLFAVNG